MVILNGFQEDIFLFPTGTAVTPLGTFPVVPPLSIILSCVSGVSSPLDAWKVSTPPSHPNFQPLVSHVPYPTSLAIHSYPDPLVSIISSFSSSNEDQSVWY